MLRPLDQNCRAPVQHDPSEPGPILVVAIDDHRNRRFLGDIPQALEHGARLAFWLLVNRYVERIATHREAHRHCMGDCASISSSKMGDPSISQ